MMHPLFMVEHVCVVRVCGVYVPVLCGGAWRAGNISLHSLKFSLAWRGFERSRSNLAEGLIIVRIQAHSGHEVIGWRTKLCIVASFQPAN